MKANVSPHHSQTIHSNSCSGLLQQIHAYQDELTTSPSSHDVLEIALAVACSLDISKSDDSALLWIMIAGVPSADKTATVLSLREPSCIKLLDTLTENALASGYINPHQPSQSPDLLPQSQTTSPPWACPRTRQ